MRWFIKRKKRKRIYAAYGDLEFYKIIINDVDDRLVELHIYDREAQLVKKRVVPCGSLKEAKAVVGLRNVMKL